MGASEISSKIEEPQNSQVSSVELREITKSFAGLKANDSVDWKLRPGSIHGIVGENGAGKSTLMKILFGMLAPDSGEILVNGKKKSWSGPRAAMESGIGMVHQHFMLAETHSALENIVLGVEHGWRSPGSPSSKSSPSSILRSLSPYSKADCEKRIREIVSRYGLEIDLGAKVSDLGVGVQQRIEIVKLLYRKASVLILDEPTAVLTPQEVLGLFTNLKKLRDEGKSIVIITHKLKEVLDLTDEVTVMRTGQVTARLKTNETNEREIARAMVGRDVILNLEVSRTKVTENSAVSVELIKKSSESVGSLKPIHLKIHRGEILGIAGVEGNGQDELIQCLINPRENLSRADRLEIIGAESTTLSPGEIRRMGTAIIPQDRHREGLMLGFSVRENFLVGNEFIKKYSKMGWIRGASIRADVADAIERFDIRPKNMESLARELSGGNQQKVVIAREFERHPSFLIAAQPTRGVDIGAIEFIHKELVSLRDRGAAILLVSSELEEILTLSDRIAVLYDREVVSEYTAAEASEERIGLDMGGAVRA